MKRNIKIISLSFLIVFLCFFLSCRRKQPITLTEKPTEIIGDINIIPKPNSIRRLPGQFEINAETKLIATDEFGIKTAVLLNETLLKDYGLVLEITDNTELPNSITFLTVPPNKISIAEEGYLLKIEPNYIQLEGKEKGLFYGIQSLTQLFPIEYKGEIKIPATEISDAPRFRYRGMHLDVSRHFMPVEFIKKYVSLISRYKYNYFHWHLTDDQGWRIEIKKYPKLTEIGSRRKETVYKKNYKPYVGDGVEVKGFYTQDEIRDVVEFAKAKQVTIIPEIDLPGHSSAALAAYPEFGCKENYSYKVQTTWGGFPDIYCPKEKTFDFIKDVLSEVIELFPNSPYIHIGGDEIKTDHWKESRFVQALKRNKNLESEEDVQNWFIQRIQEIVNSQGKKTIVWDEVIEGNLKRNATIMAWQDISRGIKAARAKHQVIMTPPVTYFDHPQGNLTSEPLGLGEPITFEQVYKYEPVPPQLSKDESRYIIGAQGCVWTEFMKTPKDVEYMAFPRAIALSEVLWSEKENKDFDGFLTRLKQEFLRLDRENVNYRIPEPFGHSNEEFSSQDEALIDFVSPIPEGKIFYTVDGTNPNLESDLYQEPFTINIKSNQTTEMKVIVVNSDGRKSSVFTTKIRKRPKSFDQRGR